MGDFERCRARDTRQETRFSTIGVSPCIRKKGHEGLHKDWWNRHWPKEGECPLN